MKQQQEKHLVLTMEDLAQSAKEYGIHIKKPGKFFLSYKLILHRLLCR
jgi:hypothetical protein